MPGKHGMTKNKEGMPKNYKGMPKNYEDGPKKITSESQKQALMDGAKNENFKKAIAKEKVMPKMKKGMPKNYNGMTKNFAMKNKMLSDSAKNGVPMQKNFLGKVGKAMMGPAGMLLTKKPGSTQEKDENKKSTDTVVNPDTNVVTDVATQRLIKAGAPKEVIEKAKAKFIARETSKNKK